MSTMAYTSDEQNENLPKIMPAEVGSVAAAWWLTLGLSLLLFTGLLPIGPRPLVVDGTITTAGWLGYLGLGALLLAVGVYVGSKIRSGQPGALKLCRLSAIFLLVLDFAVTALVIVLAARNKPEGDVGGMTLLIGPAPLAGMMLLALLVLMPVLFALMIFSLSSAPVVQEYFAPPEREMAVSYGADEAAGGRWEGASAAGGFAAAAGGVAVAGDGESETVSLSDPYVGVDPPSRVSSEAFDAALAEEMPATGDVEEVPEVHVDSSAVGDELPSAAAESSISEVFAEPIADVESPEGSIAEVTAEMDDAESDAIQAMPDAEAFEDEADAGIAIFEGSQPPAEGDSFIVKGPPRLTESQVEIKDMDDPPELTGLEPAETWDFTKRRPEDGEKKKS